MTNYGAIKMAMYLIGKVLSVKDLQKMEDGWKLIMHTGVLKY